MSKKLLTVSIAAFQVESYIREALEPFTAEEIRDKVEVLVIDDGGGDRTLAIAQQYAERYPDTFFPIHKENGGWGSTVNYGICHARGKYLKLLDGDDRFSSEALKRLLAFAEKSDADILYTSVRTFEDVTEKTIRIDVSPESRFSGAAIPLDQAGFPAAPQMHAICVRTSRLRDNGAALLEHCFYTDVEFTLKALCYSETIAYLDTPVYEYRIGREGQSVSRVGLCRHYHEHQSVLARCLQFEKERHLTGGRGDAVRTLMQNMVDSQYYIYLLLPPRAEHCAEMAAFDKTLKKNFDEHYRAVRSRAVKLLRCSHYLLYPCLARYIQKTDQRRI